jgi:hypothetical protein
MVPRLGHGDEDRQPRKGMKNPMPRIQMIDGFNAGWIDFPNRGADARKGCIGIDQAIATLIHRELA